MTILLLTPVKYSASSFNVSRFSPVSRGLSANVATMASVQGWLVVPENGASAVSRISTPASAAFSAVM